MIRFTCPKCETGLKSSDDKAGTKTTCPRCGERLRVPSPDDEPADEQLDEEAGAPDEEEAARTKGAKGNKGKTKAGAPAKEAEKKSSVLLFAGVGIAAFVVVAGGVVWFLSQGQQPQTPPAVAHNTPSRAPEIVAPKPKTDKAGPKEGGKAPDAARPSEGAKPGGTDKANQPSAKEAEPGGSQVAAKPDAKPETKLGGAAEAKVAAPDPAATMPMSTEVSSLQGPQIYNRVLKSVCWCVTVGKDGVSSGSGSLVDRPNRLVLTNYHVVKQVINDKETKLLLFFPMYERGQPVADREPYISLVKRGEGAVPAWVESFDTKRDLALIKIAAVPDTTQPIQLSSVPVVTGQPVYSVGNPGAAGALWVLSVGAARTPPYHQQVKIGAGGPEDTINLDCKVFETQTPTNPGDSGGPLVNERAQLVGVTESGWRGDVAHLMTMFIDVSEVRRFLDEYYTSHRIKPPADLTAPAVDPTAGMDVAKLIRALGNKVDPSTRARAAVTLGQIGGDARAAVPWLVRALQDKELPVRRSAAEALTQIGGLTETDVLALCEAILKDPEPDVRLAVARILKSMGEEATSAVPALRKAAAESDPRVRLEAIKAVEQLGSTGKDALPEITKALESDKVSEIRAEAALALSKFGADAKPAVPSLIQALKKDHNLDVRINVLVTLEALGPEAKDAVPALTEMLKDRHREVRRRSIQALGAMGPDAKPAVTDLLPFFEDPELREVTGETIAKIGKDAVKPLLKVGLVLHAKPDVRLTVVQTLGKIGPDAKAALPALLLLSRRDRVPAIQQAATEAIKSIQGKAISGP